MASVMIDAGHGGSDPGAVYMGRQEKDDTLNLAMAVGEILTNQGVDVYYTRTEDIYETPFQKAMDGNQAGVDYYVSIHRNAAETPGSYNGVQTLVYSNDGIRKELAENINSELVSVGFRDAGIVERPNLVVLKRTKMPAALVEVGFIDSDVDNRMLDNQFNDIANGIAQGVLKTIYQNGGGRIGSMQEEVMTQLESISQTGSEYGMDMMEEVEQNKKLYRVQVGAYRNKENADRILSELLTQGFPAFMIYDDGLYLVQVGAYEFLPNAIRMENKLRRYRYNTYITT